MAVIRQRAHFHFVSAWVCPYLNIDYSVLIIEYLNESAPTIIVVCDQWAIQRIAPTFLLSPLFSFVILRSSLYALLSM